jgi:hypothetical protein
MKDGRSGHWTHRRTEARQKWINTEVKTRRTGDRLGDTGEKAIIIKDGHTMNDKERTGRNITEQNKTEQNKTGQNRIE